MTQSMARTFRKYIKKEVAGFMAQSILDLARIYIIVVIHNPKISPYPAIPLKKFIPILPSYEITKKDTT